MNTTTKLVTVLGILAVVAGGSYRLGVHAPARVAENHERPIVCYQDSMHPWVKSDRPGKCTICSMDLTPIFEGDTGPGRSDNLVVLSPNSVTVTNVQTSAVRRQPLVRTLRVAGTLEANETHTTIISAPAPARIQQVEIEFTGVEVEAGQTLLTLLSPELVQKRAYLSSLGGAVQPGAGKPTPYFIQGSDPYSSVIIAPQAGIIVERNAFTGQYVGEGEKLLTIVDASVLWFRFDVYEQQLPWLALGQEIDVTVAAIPRKVFRAIISFIEPSLNASARTVRVRADLDNPVVSTSGRRQRLLRFGMYAEGNVKIAIPDVVTVARSAVLLSGGPAFAYVDNGAGAYERREVELGRQGDDTWEVVQGLSEGEQVVTTGNVLIDAQAQVIDGGQPRSSAAQSLFAKPTGGSPSPTRMIEVATDRSTSPAATSATDEAGLAAERADDAMDEAETALEKFADGEKSSINSVRIRANRARASIRDELWSMRMTAIASANAPSSVSPANSAAAPGARVRVSARHDAPMEPPGAYTGLPTVIDPGAVLARNRNCVESAADESARRAVEVRATLVEAMPSPPSNDVSPVATAQPAAPASPNVDEHAALKDLVLVCDALGQALAADDLAKFNQLCRRLDTVLTRVQHDVNPSQGWHPFFATLADLVAQGTAPSLADARAHFLPFSTAVVAWTQQLRKRDPFLSALKIYHCPMAPAPGLWMQTNAPLANPFYGAQMLRCGEEVE